MQKPADYQDPKTVEVMFSAQQIAERIDSLANEIVSTIGKDFIIVGLLRGSFVFTADLIRALHKHGAEPQIDFMTLSSYGIRKEGGNLITIERDIADDVMDRTVLIVDDILESGRTLDYARTIMLKRGAKILKICVLLEKPGKRRAEVEANFVGFMVPDRFVVGFGLDYANFYRELPFIGALD
ncbi:MAG: hypoxanthine phosphoribosyltransferase [Rickettsiales bacterium]